MHVSRGAPAGPIAGEEAERERERERAEKSVNCWTRERDGESIGGRRLDNYDSCLWRRPRLDSKFASRADCMLLSNAESHTRP